MTHKIMVMSILDTVEHMLQCDTRSDSNFKYLLEIGKCYDIFEVLQRSGHSDIY